MHYHILALLIMWLVYRVCRRLYWKTWYTRQFQKIWDKGKLLNEIYPDNEFIYRRLGKYKKDK